jgi:hypothetical protein
MPDAPAILSSSLRSLALWILVIATLLLIPLKITSYGYAPGGDARRHVGRAFSDKPFRDIVIMRPEYRVDQSYGWESLLRLVRRATGWGADGLMAFSVAALLFGLFAAPLPWLRRPEAWLAALLAFTVATPDVMGRLSQARPLLLTEAVLIAILFGWSRPGKISPAKLILTTLGFAASVFFHGAWYLWVLPLAAFFMAGAWRETFWLTLCWAAGVILGASLTGHPVDFLEGTLFMAGRVFNEHIPQWMLVGEFNPSGGELPSLILLALVYLWRRQLGGAFNLTRSPVFWLMALAWVGGFKADRWWADWGIPALLVWLAMQFEEIVPALIPEGSGRRLLLGGLLALPLFLHTTSDLDRRYSHTLDYPVLDASDPALQGWLPGDGGIFYNTQMDFFYNTFYQNPRAGWRYLVGFEPALMPDEDLRLLREIQRHPGNYQNYRPWIARMKPADRMVIYANYQPPLPQLEWENPAGDIWLGRLPNSAR